MDTRYRSAIGTAAFVGLLVAAGQLIASGQTPPPTPPSKFTEASITQSGVYKVDSVEFKLAPGEGMEYKYRIEKGGTLVYTWRATGPVEYDMHSEADGAPKGTAESFGVGTADRGHGSYTAPFPGIHGWFWQNKSQQEISLKLTSAGFYASAQEFRKNLRQPYVLKDVEQ
jgi:hypothetical protein